ncbi:MAG: hypothetical protein LBJ00_15580 [Planctomycetaceae bacterium]|jgi:hypothetical protein|nr:hypothetical protein [Planctomycetaceae bacterium]
MKLNTQAQQREAVVQGRSLSPYRLRYKLAEKYINCSRVFFCTIFDGHKGQSKCLLNFVVGAIFAFVLIGARSLSVPDRLIKLGTVLYLSS